MSDPQPPSPPLGQPPSQPPKPRQKQKRVASTTGRHSASVGRKERGNVWDAQWIGVIPGYPRTQELFEQRLARNRARWAEIQARGLATTKGIPQGWAGRRSAVAAVRQAASTQSKEIVALMVEKNIVAFEDDAQKVALEYAVEVVRDPTQVTTSRLAASRLVLDFTKAKPASKSDVTVHKAEDFLAALAAEVGAKKG